MKILYHHRTASRDGQEVHISELVAALRRRGHDVHVVSPGGADEERARDEGRMGGMRGGLAGLRALLPDALLPVASRLYDEVFTRRVVREARSFGAELLYERHALRNRVGVKAKRLLGVPLVLEVNAPLAREEAALGRVRDADAALRREIEVLGRADAVLVVTGVLRDLLIADGVAADRLHVVPNGVDPGRFLGPPQPDAKRRFGVEGRVVLGFVGFPRPWHGLERAVRALAAGRSAALREAVLLVGGEGPALAPLLAAARELGVAERVIAAGTIGRADVPAFLDAFDVALQPRATPYASPLKLFEYLARGLAVLAPRQRNLLEVVRHGESAWLFDPDDEGDFARRLDELCRDGQLRRRLGEGGRKRVVEGGFTWDANAERVERIAAALGVACGGAP